ncbi:hypothetical protein RND71_000253 [Anisodus tanguticus]|uniref:TF-B3 domain-containing protein n=1 Tax=Anisodus tanguticus TaxID=243964 RepID=A0AAE1SZ41_9SOLA|nr:hypothetical protein RND71_000253 [Anisodus tanguticus]
MNGKLPRKVSLRDRFGNMWAIGVTKTGRNFHFQYGWEKFIKENTIEFGDFLTFDYDGNGVFDFKLLGTTGCEKKGAGGLKLDVKEEDEEEMNVEHQKSEVPKWKWPSDSSSFDDNDEGYVVEEEEEEDEEYDVADEEFEEERNERATIIFKKKEPRSKGRHVEEEEEKDDDDKEEFEKEVKEEEKEEEEETEKVSRSKHRHVEEEKETETVPRSKHKFVDEEKDEEENNERASIKKKAPCTKCRFAEEEEDDEEEESGEETEEKEEEKEKERAGTFKKKAPCSKAGCKRGTVRKVRESHDPFGKDIFRNGRTTQPKNPYFVAKIRAERKDQLYVPFDVVRDYKLELPPSMTIRDSAGREVETKSKNWKDGRIWLHGGWRKLCRLNLVEKNDRCICEFVREGNKGLYLQRMPDTLEDEDELLETVKLIVPTDDFWCVGVMKAGSFSRKGKIVGYKDGKSSVEIVDPLETE